MLLYMSIFEIIMLLGFGAAWPFSIYKSWKTKQVGSKSILFLTFLLLGYISGITHKILYAYDGVIFFYILNALMVSTDMALYFRNKAHHLKLSAGEKQ